MSTTKPKAEPKENKAWKDNSIQFPRLIAEILATVTFTPEQMEALTTSMDLEEREIDHLMYRAQDEWDNIKAVLAEGYTIDEARQLDQLDDKEALASIIFEPEHASDDYERPSEEDCHSIADEILERLNTEYEVDWENN